MNLKSDMPQVHTALSRLEQELQIARQSGQGLLKVVHGYGSSGVGGDIRIAVQKRLLEMSQGGQIRGCIFGENWSKSAELTWSLLLKNPEVKQEPALCRKNPGFTIVLL